MCASYQFKGKVQRPGRPVVLVGPDGTLLSPWVGFARNEILAWWRDKKGAIEVDLPASRFAERSEKTGQLVWDEVPEGFVIRGLLLVKNQTPLVKVVTRASTAEEMLKFEHARMPLLEPPVFGPPEEIETDLQPELF